MDPVLVPEEMLLLSLSRSCCLSKAHSVGSSKALDVLTLHIRSQGTSALQGFLGLQQSCQTALGEVWGEVTFFLALGKCWLPWVFILPWTTSLLLQEEKAEKQVVTEKTQDVNCQFLNGLLLSQLFPHFCSPNLNSRLEAQSRAKATC